MDTQTPSTPTHDQRLEALEFLLGQALLALEADSVFFEAKAGPFVPLSPEEIATWSPAEGSPQASKLLQDWYTRFE